LGQARVAALRTARSVGALFRRVVFGI